MWLPTSVSSLVISDQSPASREYDLYCLPYAGGSVAIYSPWRTYIPDNIRLHAVELPGRGSRFAEEPAQNADVVAQELALDIVQNSSDVPLVLFGHSMGGYLAHAITRVLLDEHNLAPHVLCISAAPPRPSGKRGAPLHQMTDDDLVSTLVSIGSTSLASADNPELLQLTLPTLRADCKMFETYRISASPLPCPILEFQEETTANTEKGSPLDWSTFTSAAYQSMVVSGEHYFIDTAYAEIIDHIAVTLNNMRS